MASRRAADPKLIRFFYVSFAVHLIALTAVAVASLRNPRPEFNFNVMQVKLYSAATIAAQSAQDLATSKAVAAEPVRKPAAAPTKDKKGKAILPKDALKEDISKGSGSAQAVSDADRKRVQNAISDLAREVGSSDQAGVDAEWSSLVSGINADLERRAYGKRAGDVYFRSWSVPASVGQDARLRVRVVVRIAQDGKVMDYQIFSKSGNAELDRSVARLLDTVQQLPPPPWTEGSGWYSLAIEFRPYAEE